MTYSNIFSAYRSKRKKLLVCKILSEMKRNACRYVEVMQIAI